MTAASSWAASGLAGSLMRAPPAAPLARPRTVSLVLVSPSTVICREWSRYDSKREGGGFWALWWVAGAI